MNVRRGDRSCLECHHTDVDPHRLDFALVLPQLRQMLPARQSTEMAMEHEQQPFASILFEPMDLALRILQLERDRGTTQFIFHASSSHFIRGSALPSVG